MITENLSTLKIHKLSQAQYERELASGNTDESALYLTPYEEIDLSPYATVQQVNNKADVNHNHNDIYYTETEIDILLSSKANTSHGNHVPITQSANNAVFLRNDNTWATVTPANIGAAPSSHNHTVANITDLKVTATELNYMDGIESNVQEQLDGKANSEHEHSATNITSGTLSSDRLPTVPINKGGTGATTAATALINLGITATATELNKLDGVTATTAELNYVYGVTSNIQTQLNEKQAFITGGASTITSSNLTANRALISNSSGKVAVSAITSTELGYLDGVTSNVQEQLDGKAPTSHSHAIADITNLQSTLDDKATQTSLDTHASNTTKHITSTERTNWGAAYTHSQSAHAPSNAEKNQNAFSNIAVSGQTTVAADAATDTLTFAGSNVTITTDATNDKVTFSVADGTTSAKGIVQLTNSTSSTSTTTAATPSSVKSAYDLANTAKTNAATAQTRADSAYELANSKVDSLSDLGVTATAAELNKLDGVTATATELNYVDGVTSNIQTQLNGKATVDDIANFYVWKKYDSNPNGIKQTAISNVQISWRISTGGYSTNFNVRYSDNISSSDGNILLVNESTLSITSVNEANNLRGKYIYSSGNILSGDSNEGYYFIPSDATFTIQNNDLFVSSANKLSLPAFICYVTSESSDDFPYLSLSEHSDGYWYRQIGQIGDAVSTSVATVDEVKTYLGI